MFEREKNLEEKKRIQEILDILGIDPIVFEKLRNFLYSPNLPTSRETSDIDPTDSSYVVNLLFLKILGEDVSEIKDSQEKIEELEFILFSKDYANNYPNRRGYEIAFLEFIYDFFVTRLDKILETLKENPGQILYFEEDNFFVSAQLYFCWIFNLFLFYIRIDYNQSRLETLNYFFKDLPGVNSINALFNNNPNLEKLLNNLLLEEFSSFFDAYDLQESVYILFEHYKKFYEENKHEDLKKRLFLSFVLKNSSYPVVFYQELEIVNIIFLICDKVSQEIKREQNNRFEKIKNQETMQSFKEFLKILESALLRVDLDYRPLQGYFLEKTGTEDNFLFDLKSGTEDNFLFDPKYYILGAKVYFEELLISINQKNRHNRNIQKNTKKEEEEQKKHTQKPNIFTAIILAFLKKFL